MTQSAPFSMPKRHFNISQILYSIGVLIVLVGIVIMIGQNWGTLNSVARVAVTLGAGLVAYISASLFFQYPAMKVVSYAAYVISAILIPFGMGVLLYEIGAPLDEPRTYDIVFAVTLAIYAFTLWINRQNLFIALTAIFSGCLYFAFIATVINETNILTNVFNLFAYATIAFGIGLILVGYGLREGSHYAMTTPFYVAGLFAALGAALSIGGIWLAIYPFIIFGVIYLSLYLKSKAFLRIGALFLIAYIFRVTGEYFGENLGWPLALVLAGLLLVGVGYLTYFIGKRYLTEPAV